MYDLTVAISFHADQLAQGDDIRLNMIGISNCVGMAILQVDRGGQAPRFPLPDQVFTHIGRGRCWGHRWKDHTLCAQGCAHAKSPPVKWCRPTIAAAL